MPDTRTLLRCLGATLERHLVGSLAEGYTGDLKLNFFRGGLRLAFNRGRLEAVDRWTPATLADGDAQMPEAAFTQIVLGWRRFHELADHLHECRATRTAVVLLEALFPTFRGKVWMLS